MRKLWRRRESPAAPPTIRQESLDKARQSDARADEALRWVEAQDQAVDERRARIDRIHRENNLGPAFMRVLGGRHP